MKSEVRNKIIEILAEIGYSYRETLEELRANKNNLNNYLSGLLITKGNEIAEEYLRNTNKAFLLDDALRYFDRAVFYSPENVDANRFMGFALIQIDELKKEDSNQTFIKALGYFNKAIQLDLKDFPSYAYRGVCYGKLAANASAYSESRDYFLKAFSQYNIAAKLKSSFYFTFNNWGCDQAEWATRNDGQQAIDYFKKAFDNFRIATELEPKNPQAWSNWAYALMEMSEYKDGDTAKALLKDSVAKQEKSFELGGPPVFHYDLFDEVSLN